MYGFMAWTGRTLLFFTEISVYLNFDSHSIKMSVSTQYTLRKEIRLIISQIGVKRNYTLQVDPTLR